MQRLSVFERLTQQSQSQSWLMSIQQNGGSSSVPWPFVSFPTLAPAPLVPSLRTDLIAAQARIAELEAVNAQLSALIEIAKAAADDLKPEPSRPVDIVIDQLDKRLIGDADRGRLRRSLDTADRPATGRRGADEGVGRALGRVSVAGLRVP